MDLLTFCSTRIHRKDVSDTLHIDSDYLQPQESDPDVVPEASPSTQMSPRETELSPDEFIKLGVNLGSLKQIIPLCDFSDDYVKSLTLKDVYDQFVLPATASSGGRSFCEMLQNHDKDEGIIGEATWILSTPLSEKYIETVERLEAYFSKKENRGSNIKIDAPVYIWISIFSDRQPIFCSSQIQKIEVSSASLKSDVWWDRALPEGVRSVQSVLWAPGYTASGVHKATSSSIESLYTVFLATQNDTCHVSVLLSARDTEAFDSILYGYEDSSTQNGTRHVRKVNSDRFKWIQSKLCKLEIAAVINKDELGFHENLKEQASVMDEKLLHILDEWLFVYTTSALQSALSQSLSLQSQEDRDHHIKVSKLRKICAQQYALRGDPTTTESLLKSRWDANQTYLAPTESERIGSLNDIAYLYRSSGQYELAEPYFQERWEYRKQLLRGDHYHALAAQRDLANIYRYQGKFEAAEDLLVSSLQSQVVTLGSEHAETRITLKDLDELYRSTDQLDLLQQLKVGQLQSTCQSFGPTHNKTISAEIELGNTHILAGKRTEAEEVFRKCLRARQTTVGNYHADTLAVLQKLAETYSIQGKYTEALKTYEFSIKLHTRMYGERHKDTLAVLASLAVVYSQLGQRDHAISIYTRILDFAATDESTLDPASEQSASVLFKMRCYRALAMEYTIKNKLHEAVSTLRCGLQLTDDRIENSGDLDYTLCALRLSMTGDLSSLYNQLGERTNYAETLTSGIPLITSLLGSQHHKTVKWVLKTADAYRTIGTVSAYTITEPLYNDCISVLTHDYTPEQLDTQLLTQVQQGLATLFTAQGRFHEAESILTMLLARYNESTQLPRRLHNATESEEETVQCIRQSLASVYTIQGKWEAARMVLEDRLATARKRKTRVVTDTDITDNSEVFVSTTADTKTHINRLNTDMLHAMLDLAEVHTQLGNCMQAEQLYYEGLTSSAATWGANHSLTCQLTHTLINFYSRDCSCPCHCHEQKVQSVTQLYRGLLNMFHTEANWSASVSTLRRFISWHVAHDIADTSTTLRPLYIELLTCLREQDKLLVATDHSSIIAQELNQDEQYMIVQDIEHSSEQITANGDDPIDQQIASDSTDTNTPATRNSSSSEDATLTAVRDENKTQLTDNEPCMDARVIQESEEILCLRVLLTTYERTEVEQYRWRQELINKLTETHGPDDQKTVDAMLDLASWLRERHLSLLDSPTGDTVTATSSASVQLVTGTQAPSQSQIIQGVDSTANTSKESKNNTPSATDTDIIKLPDAQYLSALYRDCLERVRLRVGPDDDYTLAVLTQLAAWYSNTQRWEEAEPLLQEVHDTVKRIHGESSQQTKEAAEALTTFYIQSGRPDPSLNKTSRKGATKGQAASKKK